MLIGQWLAEQPVQLGFNQWSMNVIDWQGTLAYTGREVGTELECLKALGFGLIDSTGNYEYAVNEDGTAKIIRYLKEEN